MQQQASICRLSIQLCFNLSSVLNYFHSDERDPVINRKLHSKQQTRVEAIKNRKKINCSIGAGHSGKGVINIPPVYSVGITPKLWTPRQSNPLQLGTVIMDFRHCHLWMGMFHLNSNNNIIIVTLCNYLHSNRLLIINNTYHSFCAISLLFWTSFSSVSVKWSARVPIKWASWSTVNSSKTAN